MEQRSGEWHAARLGKVTASRVADATARSKTGWGASRANYMAELLVERLTGQPVPQYTNSAMEWGTQYEAEALTIYEFERNVAVEPVGFIAHPYIDLAGASPDGFVAPVGLVEIKCPNTATHIETLLDGAIPERYTRQMQWQMACCGRMWCDWMSYDPRLPLDLRIVLRRIERDDKLILKLEAEVREFLDELATKEAALRGISGERLRQQLKQSAEAA